MNASFTKKPTPAEHTFAKTVSAEARKLVSEYANEVSAGSEWNNLDNIDNTRTRLLSYISALELKQ